MNETTEKIIKYIASFIILCVLAFLGYSLIALNMVNEEFIKTPVIINTKPKIEKKIVPETIEKVTPDDGINVPQSDVNVPEIG